MRVEHGTDFTVDVEKLGRFTFGRRKMRDQFLIRGEYNRLTNGDYLEDRPANLGAWAIATLAVLTVKSPPEFTLDPDKVDPLLDDYGAWENQVADVYGALRAKELSFRPDSAPAVQKDGEGVGDKL